MIKTEAIIKSNNPGFFLKLDLGIQFKIEHHFRK